MGCTNSHIDGGLLCFRSDWYSHSTAPHYLYKHHCDNTCCHDCMGHGHQRILSSNLNTEVLLAM